MTAARCPLVREIRDAADAFTDATQFVEAQRDASLVIENVYWPRIRAALEAAEEMALVTERKWGRREDEDDALKLYRAATRKP